MFEEDEDPDLFKCEKFDDCKECKHRFSYNVCVTCDVGEEFEEMDYDELDKHFMGRI